MNLQQIIDGLEERLAEYKINADRQEAASQEAHPTGPWSQPRPPFAFRWAEWAIRERVDHLKQQLAAEQSGNAAQEAELKRALKREGPVDESSS